MSPTNTSNKNASNKNTIDKHKTALNNGVGKNLRATRSQTKTIVQTHDQRYDNLVKEQNNLINLIGEGLATSQDTSRLEEVNKSLKLYNTATGQTEDGEPMDAENSSETTDNPQRAQGDDQAESSSAAMGNAQRAQGDDQAESSSAAIGNAQRTSEIEHAKAPRLAVNDAQGVIKREQTEAKENLTDNDLGMTWTVDIDDSHFEPSLGGVPKQAFGHRQKGLTTLYCVRYGDNEAFSAKFDSTLPTGDTYDKQRDVTQRSNRIVERIVEIHREKRQPLPDFLSQVQILVVYWENKRSVGHDAGVEVLDPDFRGKRPPTRCFIRLNPKLYKDYDIKNNTGYSHETRSIMKLIQKGCDDWQKSISLYNKAVQLENAFEEKFMGNVSGRPPPLCELVDERSTTERRSKSRYIRDEESPNERTSMPRLRSRTAVPEAYNRSTNVDAEPILLRSMSPRQLTPPTRDGRHKRGTTEPIGKKTPREQFHTDYCELFEKDISTKYEDLSKKEQAMYVAQFTEWKALNM